MKKVSVILNAVVISAMMLSSCGGGASKEEGATKEEGTATEVADGGTSKEEGASKEVTIGKQVWMTENLDVDKFRNGDPIPHVITDEEWEKARENKQPAWCYYGNDPSNGVKYGKLYNWYAVRDPRGLAPAGWHIPSLQEWTVLTDYLSGKDVAGTKMKSSSGWKKGNGTNESGFSGVPGGSRSIYGWFNDIGQYGYWWSSTELLANGSYIGLNYLSDSVNGPNTERDRGFSVRCLRD